MQKKIILVAITFAVGVAAYWLFSSGDRPASSRTPQDTTDAVRKFVSRPDTQPVQTIRDANMEFSPGEHTLARVYDDVSGRLKYQFEAKKWEPITETAFHLEDLRIQIHSPRGEITYIRADEAEVTVARRSRNRVEPRRGWMRGGVKVTIDRTTSAWREANPAMADLYAHPDELVHIDMQQAHFDLDQAELRSDGAVRVDSTDARVEDVKGLSLQWNQVDNRIDVLRFEHGGRMTLQRGGKMVDFLMPGTERAAAPSAPGGLVAADQSPERGRVEANPPVAPAANVQRAQAMKPMSIDAVTAEEAAAEIRLEAGLIRANQPRSLNDAVARQPSPAGPAQPMRSDEELAAAVETMKNETRAGRPATQPDVIRMAKGPRKKRIHTYHAVFSNQVVVEQKEGLRTIGKMEADRMEILFDFGSRQRTWRSPGGSRAGGSPSAAETDTKDTAPPEDEPPALAAAGQDQTKLVLTWDGPMELQPLGGDTAEKSGKRFDVIAQGAPVRLENEQGTARCGQLVYRHERRQVWLSGTDSDPVELAVSASRKLIGREVFLDQKRGLAQVDGPGRMIDARQEPAAGGAESVVARAVAAASLKDAPRTRKQRDPFEIRWSRGVDLEMGTHTVLRKNPSTGLRETKERDFLRRAWFHGDVTVNRDEEQVSADEVAVTFGAPLAAEELADHIRHLNMSGNVRLQRKGETITADWLDAELIVTSEGRNVPKIVDARGNVAVRQGRREFHGEQMHVVLGMVPGRTRPAPDGKTPIVGRSRLGIERLDAAGDVYVLDPEHNLKISRAQTLKAVIRNGAELARTTIESSDPAVLARARFGGLAVHGHRIEIDMDKETLDVPGPGKAWMVTRKDFNGRNLREPAPVKITWDEKMMFRMARDYGVFIGNVHSTAQTFSLDCDKMTLRFGRVPPVRKARGSDYVDRFWLLGAIVGDKAKVKETAPVGLGPERKRPVYVVAEGHARTKSVSHAASSPGGEAPGRLLSRLTITGDQIVADLAREQMSVPGRGTLLIEDYQFEPGRPALRSPRAQLGTGPLMSSMRREGPSQTLIAWENSMDFFVDRNLVAFDKEVSMLHRSGREMVMQGELAQAMGIDTTALQHLGSGRKATLTCGYLLLEFLAESGPGATSVRQTDLKRMIAKHAVHLQEGSKSLMGEHMQYLHETNEVRLEGSTALEARIVEQDEATQRLSMWRGPLLIWDRRTNRIEAPQATIRASRR